MNYGLILKQFVDMAQHGQIGDTFNIRVFAYDGTRPLTAPIPSGQRQLYIERIDDGQWWNGSGWQAAPVAVEMADLSDGSDHYDGVLEYDFAPPAADGERVYDWSNRQELGNRENQNRGRIRTFATS